MLKAAAAAAIYPPGAVAGTGASKSADSVPPATDAAPGAVAVRLDSERLALLERTVRRLKAIQKLVGYANFNLLGFDDALRFASSYSAVGKLPREELDFLEQVFSEDASRYGFYGAKVFSEITTTVSKKATVKLRGTGHYLFKGRSFELYRQIERDVGENVVLTSGVRGVVKQMHLFLAKALQTRGDLAAASTRSRRPGIPITASVISTSANVALGARTSPMRSPRPKSTSA